MKIRQPAVALLYVTLFLNLLVGCAEAADPLPDAQTHILKNGFRNTNPAFTPPSTWVRMKFIPSRTWATTFIHGTATLPWVIKVGAHWRNIARTATDPGLAIPHSSFKLKAS